MSKQTYLPMTNYRLTKRIILTKALLRPVKRFAFCVSIGRSGLNSSAVWVDVIISPFGMRMGIGMNEIFFLSHRESKIR